MKKYLVLAALFCVLSYAAADCTVATTTDSTSLVVSEDSLECNMVSGGGIAGLSGCWLRNYAFNYTTANVCGFDRFGRNACMMDYAYGGSICTTLAIAAASGRPFQYTPPVTTGGCPRCGMNCLNSEACAGGDGCPTCKLPAGPNAKWACAN